MCADAYEAAQGADAIVVATPWNEFKNLDMVKIKESLKTPILIDGRNMYEPELMKEIGFEYRGVGRGFRGEGVELTPETTTIIQ